MGSSVIPISDAVHCNRSRSALQPPLQCTASVLAVHCILHARTSHLSRKYVRPSLQVRASVLARTCVRDRLHLGIFPHVFLLSPEKARGWLRAGKKERGVSWIRPFMIPFGVISDYSATTAAVSAAAVSAAAVSATVVSTSAATLSQHTLSESAQQPCSVLLPHDAKETATTAANTNANFFISLCF